MPLVWWLLTSWHYLKLSSLQILLHYQQYNFTAYQSTLAFYHILLALLMWLGLQLFILYILLKSSRLLPKVCWQLLAKQSSVKREPVALHHVYASNCDGLEQMIQEIVCFGKFLCCIFYCFVCNWYCIFSLQVHNFTNFLF